MKFITKIFAINFLCLCVFSFSIANEKTAFINIDYIIQNSNVGKRLLSKINTQNKKNVDQLEKKNKILKDLELEIKNKKNVISENDFNKEVLSFQKKVQIFNNEKNILVKDFNNLRKKEIENIFKTINPIISAYMNENSIGILLDSKNVFMGNIGTNLTDDILKKINNEIK